MLRALFGQKIPLTTNTSAEKVAGHAAEASALEAKKAIIKASGLFDANWYCEKQANALSGEDAAIEHYLEHGQALGAAPHPLFELAWYRTNNSDLNESGFSVLEHYIHFGMQRGSSPSPLFDPAWYAAKAGDRLRPGEDPFRHFLRFGAVMGISPHPLFDSSFYFSQDKQLNGLNPLTHFISCGALQGKNPNRFFDSGWYLTNYPRAFESGMNPLVHYILEGAEAGLQPHPEIDVDRYMFQNDDAPKDRLQAYAHMVANTNFKIASTSSKPAVAQAVSMRVDEPRRDRKFDPLGWLDLSGFSTTLDTSDNLPPVPAVGTPVPRLAIGANIQLASFDIWDTVLRRDCHPDEIKLQSARYLYVKALSNLKPAYRDHGALYNARITAENASADNEEHEYRFEQALDRWLDTVLSVGEPVSLRQLLKSELLAHEFAAERRSTRADPTMVQILRGLKCPKVFASDFYMSGEFITELLAAHKLRDHFIRGYASSDTFETKRSGQMFDRIIKDTQTPAPNILHIGDHAHADIEVPKAKGLATSHFLIDGETDRKVWYEAAFNAWRRNDATRHHRRIAAICEDIAGGLAAQPGGMGAVGARLAPAVVGYVLSIIEDAERRKIGKVHYFTREGIFFRQVHQALVKADPYNMTYASSELLAVSRRATFAASLQGLTGASLMRLWTLYSKQSIQGLSASLNLDETVVEGMALRTGIDFKTPIVYPWQDKPFLRFLKDREFQDFATSRLGEQRNELLSYLKEKGVTEATGLLISDIGWRGTIQDNLAQLLPKTHIAGHYLGLFNYLNAQPRNTAKSGWLFDEPAGMPCEIGDVAPFEMLFNGKGGSVVGYTIEGKTTIPRKVTFDNEEAIITGPVAALQAGVLAAVEPIAAYIRLHGLTAKDIRELGVLLAKSASQAPPCAIADTFLALHHNETFGTGAVEEMGGSASLIEALRTCDGSELHTEAGKLAAGQRWPDASFRASEVAEWWKTAPQSKRSSIPTEYAKIYSPAMIKARGSKLAVFTPSPIRASGGHRTIFNMVRRLAKLGLEPVIFMEGVGAGVPVVEEYLAGTQATIHTQWHMHIPSDVAFATIAHSASFVAGLDNTHVRGYLVQDFEAMFNPMSDGYVIAENSYAQGLQHFTIGNWLTHVINTRYGAASAPAGLGVDTKVYRPLDGPNDAPVERELAVCFLYQPDKPRRTPILGIEALRAVKQAMPEVTIYVFGSDLPLNLDFEVVNLGLITDLGELNKLYNRCVAGLCISGSNPSRIPYEMMAAGCVPIDLYRYNNLLDHKAGTALLAYQNAASISEALMMVLTDPIKAETMSQAARTFAASRTLDWEVDVIASNLFALMDNKLPAFSPINMMYSDAPIVAAQGDTAAILRFCEAQKEAAVVKAIEVERARK